MNTLKHSGAVTAIQRVFNNVNPDRRIQAIIVGYVFGAFIEDAAGNMVCVNNVVAACATTGTIGNEGKIIKTNALPCLIYCLISIAVLGGMILLGVDPLGLAAAAG